MRCPRQRFWGISRLILGNGLIHREVLSPAGRSRDALSPIGMGLSLFDTLESDPMRVRPFAVSAFPMEFDARANCSFVERTTSRIFTSKILGIS